MSNDLIDPATVSSTNELSQVEAVDFKDEDVLKLAKPSCGHCHGSGTAGTNVAFGKSAPVLCGCVVRRVERMERMVEKADKLLLEKN